MSGPAECRKAGGKGIPGRYRFLLIMLAAYALVGLWRPTAAAAALRGFLAMLVKVVPILALVFCFLLGINLLGPDRIRKYLGRESGWKGWLLATVGGVFISGPPYILYPLLAELRQHGVRDAFIGVILYNRNVKIPFLPVMIYYFGLSYTVVLSGYIILFAIVNGKLLELFLRAGQRSASSSSAGDDGLTA